MGQRGDAKKEVIEKGTVNQAVRNYFRCIYVGKLRMATLGMRRERCRRRVVKVMLVVGHESA